MSVRINRCSPADMPETLSFDSLLGAGYFIALEESMPVGMGILISANLRSAGVYHGRAASYYHHKEETEG